MHSTYLTFPGVPLGSPEFPWEFHFLWGLLEPLLDELWTSSEFAAMQQGLLQERCNGRTPGDPGERRAGDLSGCQGPRGTPDAKGPQGTPWTHGDPWTPQGLTGASQAPP